MTKNVIFLTICFAVIGITGCISLPKPDLSKMVPPGPVTTVVAAWEPAVSNGEEPMRGFGGRVYFHDRDMRPAKIKGKVIVYIFDEEGRMPGDERPNEGIVFDEKTLNGKGVYKKSSLGHSYNLWVPFDSAGPDGPAKKVSLIVRYIPNQGSQVVSSQTTVFLPGRSSPETFATWQTHTESGPVHQASVRERSAPQRMRQSGEQMIESVSERPREMQSVRIR